VQQITTHQNQQHLKIARKTGQNAPSIPITTNQNAAQVSRNDWAAFLFIPSQLSENQQFVRNPQNRP
jgi:hypothetical protein